MPGILDRATFRVLVKNAPLVSIDLIVRNELREVLLGLRKNSPAKDTWFVPGGRIWKDETIEVAFKRITEDELGTAIDLKNAEFIGVYDHLHEGNFANEAGYGTHYIVLAHEIKMSTELNALPLKQHGVYDWFSEQRLLQDARVHPFTKDYFR